MFKELFASPDVAGLVAHGTCLLWRPDLLLLHPLELRETGQTVQMQTPLHRLRVQ
jgi:hypothetical protein